MLWLFAASTSGSLALKKSLNNCHTQTTSELKALHTRTDMLSEWRCPPLNRDTNSSETRINYICLVIIRTMVLYRNLIKQSQVRCGVSSLCRLTSRTDGLESPVLVWIPEVGVKPSLLQRVTMAGKSANLHLLGVKRCRYLTLVSAHSGQQEGS